MEGKLRGKDEQETDVAPKRTGFLVYVCNGVPTHDYKEDDKLVGQKQVKDFCVAQLDAPYDKLQGFLDYACSHFDCSAIQPNGPCFRPDTIISHTSYALDVVYKATGNCNTEIGTKTTFDRSYDDCHYP
ncbi:hypothetical protein Pfo_002102 [Paulownia fortunei]|nr:hypothetical protein Pfo_002102 [Paulownia fortunei]